MSEPDEPIEPTGDGPLDGGPAPDELEAVVEKISTEHGFDVRGYKRTTLYRRIRKRMADARCATVGDYLVRLETDGQEYAQLVNTILINVTEFFRDPEAWESLQAECLEPLVRNRAPDEPIRAWSAGCATGEEAYSLSICLAEIAGGAAAPIKIYATDMDEGALAVARAGVYDPDRLRSVSPERRERFFDALPGGRYRVRREVRAPVIFGHHNILEHPPISRLDVLVCRNLLIYFDAETQHQLLRRFHYALRESGCLFLGKAETLMSRSLLFRPLEQRHRVFQKASVPGLASRLPPQAPFAPVRPEPPREEVETDGPALPLEELVAPVLVLDGNGILLAASPRAREIFGISEGLLGGSLLQLDQLVRPAPLRLAVEDARATNRPARVEELKIVRPDGRPMVLCVEVRPLPVGRGAPPRLVVWCEDRTREQEQTDELSQVRQELETTTEELQTTNEELETTNEELQSTNEELETTNEELQSTNEELETTIEELQSTNEELETANEELRTRQQELDERERVQAVVLSSLQAGVIIVRGNFEVLSWNRLCEELWGIREEEAVGKSIFSLDSGMPFGLLREPLAAVMHDDAEARSLEVAAVNRRGRPIRCAVRVLPLVEPLDGGGGALVLIEAVADRG